MSDGTNDTIAPPSEHEIEAAAHSIFGMEWDTKTHRAIAKRALEAAAHARAVVGGCSPVSGEVERLRAALVQIATVANDNRSASCNHQMALSFVHMVAGKALSSGQPQEPPR